MKIFGESELWILFEKTLHELSDEVNNEPENRLLNCNETQYVEYLISKYSVVSVEIHWDKASISDRDELIPGRLFPRHCFHVDLNKEYPKQVITYHLPFSGNSRLLHLHPNPGILWSTKVLVQEQEISFDIINFYDDPEKIKSDISDIVSKIKQKHEAVLKNVERFNEELKAKSLDIFKCRKAYLLKRANLVASLEIPLKKRDNVPNTFAVPAIKRKVIVKPDAPDTKFKPEPTLDDSTYEDILKVIQDVCVEMERHPSIYQDKGEEALRDFLLMALAPNFDSTTGETFNKSGKTDILIRHENKNIFVAECKIWRGQKSFFDAIDQTLGYLTWRDSKVALILFIDNKEIAPLLQKIKEILPTHSCFVNYNESKHESYFKCEFHLLEDSSRAVKLTILCFHFPKIESK